MSLKMKDIIPTFIVTQESMNWDEWPNYLIFKFGRFPFSKMTIGFLDTDEFRANRILSRFEVRTKFKIGYKRPDSDLIFRVVKIPKKDYHKFKDAMTELRKTYAILNHESYSRSYIVWSYKYMDADITVPGSLSQKMAFEVISDIIKCGGLYDRINNDKCRNGVN